MKTIKIPAQIPLSKQLKKNLNVGANITKIMNILEKKREKLSSFNSFTE